MTTTTNCRTCGKPKDNHPFRHPFNDGSGDVPNPFKNQGTPKPDTTTPPTGPQVSTGSLVVPFDPVLRMALVMKGVITPEDLANAEKIIAATTQAAGEELMRAMNGEIDD